MAGEITKTTDVFLPEIVESEIKDGYENDTIFAQDADIDYELVGVKGNTVTMLKWSKINKAQKVTEGQRVQTQKLSQSETQAVIEQLANGVSYNELAEIQGAGSTYDQAVKQLRESMADALDDMVRDEYIAATENLIELGAKSDYRTFFQAAAKLKKGKGEEIHAYFHEDQIPDLYTAEKDNLLKAGEYNQGSIAPTLAAIEVGKIHNVRIFQTDRVTYEDVVEGETTTRVYNNIFVIPGAVKVKFQKQVKIKKDEDIETDDQVLVARSLLAVKLVNPSKLVVVKAQ